MLFSEYNYIYRQHSHNHYQCVSEQLVRIYDQLLVSMVLISNPGATAIIASHNIISNS